MDQAPSDATRPTAPALEERLQALVPDALWTLRLDEPAAADLGPGSLAEALLAGARFTSCNGVLAGRFQGAAGAGTVGLRPADLAGFWVAEDPGRLAAALTGAEPPATLAAVEVDPLGQPRRLEVRVQPLVEGAALVGVAAWERDVTAEHEREVLVREGDELYRAVSRAALEGLVVLDGGLGVADCNEAFARLTGSPRARVLEDGGCPLLPEGAGEPRAGFREALEAGHWRGHAELRRADGSWIPVVASCHAGGPDGRTLYCFVQDVSRWATAHHREREHQEALQRVSRLSTLGEMASGIAHEFNQPLAAIVNYANGCVRLLQQREVEDPMVFRALHAIVDQGQRASSIIRRLRSFAHQREAAREAFSARDLVSEAITLTAPVRARARVTLETSFDLEDDTVVAEGIQIEQVIMNLLLNAVEAVASEPHGAERRIRVVTRGTHDVGSSSGASGSAEVERRRPGFVEVSVEDSGAGVDADSAGHLFEPFFSARGGGPGLGLTIGRSIVEGHGGRLWLDPAPGEHPSSAATPPLGGACFRFTLPLRRSPMDP